MTPGSLDLFLKRGTRQRAYLVPLLRNKPKLPGIMDMEKQFASFCVSCNLDHGKWENLSLSPVSEHVAQIPLVVAGTYDTYDSVSHGTNENHDARSHDRNLASANN